MIGKIVRFIRVMLLKRKAESAYTDYLMFTYDDLPQADQAAQVFNKCMDDLTSLGENIPSYRL